MSDPAAIIVAVVVAATGAVQGANLPEPVQDRTGEIAQTVQNSESEMTQRIDDAIAGLPESVQVPVRQGVDDVARTGGSGGTVPTAAFPAVASSYRPTRQCGNGFDRWRRASPRYVRSPGAGVVARLRRRVDRSHRTRDHHRGAVRTRRRDPAPNGGVRRLRPLIHEGG